MGLSGKISLWRSLVPNFNDNKQYLISKNEFVTPVGNLKCKKLWAKKWLRPVINLLVHFLIYFNVQDSV